MDKRSVAQALGKSGPEKAFLNVSEIAKKMGTGRDAAARLVAGLPYIRDGRSKRYFSGDVAEEIVRRQMLY